MAARDLLDRSLLLLALASSGCDLDTDWVDRTPSDSDPRACELEVVGEAAPPSAEPSRLLSSTADVRIACGEHPDVWRTSVGVGADGVYVVADGSEYYNRYELYRLDDLDSGEDASVTQPSWPSTGDRYWASLQVDDGGLVSLFWKVNGPQLWRATPLDEHWRTERLILDAADRVEIAGWQPHLWYRELHATTATDGTWFEQPVLNVESMETSTTSLDGSGNQLAYAVDLEAWESNDLWTFDGTTTRHQELQRSATNHILPVPTAHPTHPTHEHAAVLLRSSGAELVWPTRESDTMIIPASSTYDNVDPDEPCLSPTNVVAARTADGRIWLAWIVSVHWSRCGGDSSVATEIGTLRLVEVNPTSALSHEVMRVDLDTDYLMATEIEFVGGVLYDGALSLAAFDQQLVMVIADGPEHARLRVLSVDTSR